jgi:hypothetical protein
MFAVFSCFHFFICVTLIGVFCFSSYNTVDEELSEVLEIQEKTTLIT